MTCLQYNLMSHETWNMSLQGNPTATNPRVQISKTGTQPWFWPDPVGRVTDYNFCKMFYLFVKYSSGLATFWATFIHFLNLFGCLLWILRQLWATLATSHFSNAAGLQASLACTDGLKLDPNCMNSSISVMSKQTNQPTNQPTKSALLQAIRAALEILGWSLATNIWARKIARSWALSTVGVYFVAWPVGVFIEADGLQHRRGSHRLLHDYFTAITCCINSCRIFVSLNSLHSIQFHIVLLSNKNSRQFCSLPTSCSPIRALHKIRFHSMVKLIEKVHQLILKHYLVRIKTLSHFLWSMAAEFLPSTITLHWLEGHFSESDFVVMSAQVIGISVGLSSYQLAHFIRIPSANPMSPEIHLWTAVQQWQRMGNHTKVGEIAIWQRFSKGNLGGNNWFAMFGFSKVWTTVFLYLWGVALHTRRLQTGKLCIFDYICRRLFVNLHFHYLNDWLQFSPSWLHGYTCWLSF